MIDPETMDRPDEAVSQTAGLVSHGTKRSRRKTERRAHIETPVKAAEPIEIEPAVASEEPPVDP